MKCSVHSHAFHVHGLGRFASPLAVTEGSLYQNLPGRVRSYAVHSCYGTCLRILLAPGGGRVWGPQALKVPRRAEHPVKNLIPRRRTEVKARIWRSHHGLPSDTPGPAPHCTHILSAAEPTSHRPPHTPCIFVAVIPPPLECPNVRPPPQLECHPQWVPPGRSLGPSSWVSQRPPLGSDVLCPVTFWSSLPCWEHLEIQGLSLVGPGTPRPSAALPGQAGGVASLASAQRPALSSRP